MKPGRCGTRTHDYKRNGTTTLFAALSMLDGTVIGDCMPRHRHQEFLRFLKKIDGVARHHLWAERYDRDLNDIFGVQDEIAQKIAIALKVILTAEEEAARA